MSSSAALPAGPGSAESAQRVLVVDDDEAIRLLAVTTLQRAGLAVSEAAGGREAIRLAVATAPDLIILDWELPDLEGIEVAREVRRLGVTCPLLMLTSRNADEDVVRALEAGADGYLAKPISPSQLAARVAAVLRRAGPAPGQPSPGEGRRRLAALEMVSAFFMQPAPALRALASRLESVVTNPGDVLISQGSPNDRLFIVDSGRYRVTVERPGGGSLPIAVLGPMDFFGALSVTSGAPAAATVTAVDRGELLVLHRRTLEGSARAGSDYRRRLEQVAAQRRLQLEGVSKRGGGGLERAHVIAVYSPKGGAGTTTLAVNLAAALAQSHSGEVCLLDLAVPFNDAALVAGLAPSSCLARMSEAGPEFDELLLSACLYHPLGFLVLPTALNPEEAELVGPALVGRAVEALGREFRTLVVDTGPFLGEALLELLERADRVVLVTTPTVASVKNLRQAIRILEKVLHVSPDRERIVINHPAARSTVSSEQVQRVLERPVAVEVRFAKDEPERSVLHGRQSGNIDLDGPIGRAAVALLATLNLG